MIVLDVLENENGKVLPAHFLTAVEWMINRSVFWKAKQVPGPALEIGKAGGARGSATEH